MRLLIDIKTTCSVQLLTDIKSTCSVYIQSNTVPPVRGYLG